ncbi:MAG: SURF1 family protein [Alphaproteobacteria bacterium]
MTFRPYPVLTLFIIPTLALLVWLGFWQLQRAEWKKGLIADFATQSAAPPLSYDAAACGQRTIIGQIIAPADISGRLAQPPASDIKPIRMFGHNAAGDAGWLIYRPVAPPACAEVQDPVLAEAGFEPLQPEPGAAAWAPPGRYVAVEFPGHNQFAPDNSPATNDWHWFDPAAIAAAFGVKQIDDHYYLVGLYGLPDELTRVPPAQHYGYAVTWFGMAIALLVIYGVFHTRAGRLSFRKQGSDKA